MCHLQEQLDLLSKEEVIPLSDPGHIDTLKCVCPGEGWWLPAQLVAPMLAAVVLLGRLCLAQPTPPEGCAYLVLPSQFWQDPAKGTQTLPL